jgi:AcrR family transcriptional regulator
LRCIVYVSCAADLWADSELMPLVEQARIANGRNGITGVLAYQRRQFVQILEGPEPAVEKLFDSIARDQRHHKMCLLLRRDVPNRAFPAWSMAVRGEQDEAEAADIAYAIRALPESPALSQMALADILHAPVAQDAPELRHPAQQDRARETIERLFRAARSLVLHGGAAALTVPRVVQEAGVSQPTFYRYFGDVNDLMRAGVRKVALRRAREWAEVIDRHHFASDANLADMVASLGTGNFMKVRGLPPPLAQAILPHVNALATEAAATLAPAVLRAIARCDLAPGVAPDESAISAMLAGMLSAAVAMASTDATLLRSDDTRRIAAGMLLGGLRAALGHRTVGVPNQ